jgi:intein/homing endonuclease
LGFKACFAAGTPLRVPGGSRNIEEIRVGDMVLSRDEHNCEGPVEAKVVEELFVREGLLWYVEVNGRRIRTTHEHPFFVASKGWVPCNELKVGDRLLSESGAWVTVESVEDTGIWSTVYNLRVADYHTYFVGKDEWGFSVWAHNADYNVTKDGKYKFASGREEAIAVKVRLKKADYDATQQAEITAKYQKANRLLYDEVETATVQQTPTTYNKYHSKKYLYETDPVIKKRVDDPTHPDHIEGGVNGIKLREEIPGQNVDEAVGRIWGGRSVKENQSVVSEYVNGKVGPTEQGIRDRLLAANMEGTRIRKFIIVWE